MRHTHQIKTTSTVMRADNCILQLDVTLEVDVEDGTDITVMSFDVGDKAPHYIMQKQDPALFAVLLEGIDKRDMLERVVRFYTWKHDNETGTMTCTGLAS